MSITFSIANGNRYVDANCPESVTHEGYDCQCKDFTDDGKADPNCRCCKGMGEEWFSIYPYELNMANGNAGTLMAALGMDFDWCGSMSGEELLKAISRTPIDLVRRETVQGAGEFYGVQVQNMIVCGICEEQATYYLDSLRDIATEAAKRNEDVVWG